MDRAKKLIIITHDGWGVTSNNQISTYREEFVDVYIKLEYGYFIVKKYETDECEDYIIKIFSLSNIKEYKVINK